MGLYLAYSTSARLLRGVGAGQHQAVRAHLHEAQDGLAQHAGHAHQRSDADGLGHGDHGADLAVIVAAMFAVHDKEVKAAGLQDSGKVGMPQHIGHRSDEVLPGLHSFLECRHIAYFPAFRAEAVFSGRTPPPPRSFRARSEWSVPDPVRWRRFSRPDRSALPCFPDAGR